jgi:hypothetical protein
MEVDMAGSKQSGAQSAKAAERPSDTPDARNQGSVSQATQQQAERLAELGRSGVQQAADASAATVTAAERSGSALAQSTEEIAAAWAHYAEEVMRNTSEASRALLRAQTFNEMLEVQARLLRDNMQAFLDQSVRIAESTSRIALRPLEALKKAGSEQFRN